MSLYRPEFEPALRAFARASEAMRRQGFEAPILVGGAAVELYSGSAITTGDFDVVTGRQDAFEAALLDQARRLFGLHPDADRDYMDKRIRHESGGDYAVADLEG